MTDVGYQVPAEDDKAYDTVAKLLAKADRTDNQAEAETFFAKAQEIITKRMLDEMVLKAKINGGDGKDEAVEHEVVNFSVTFQKADSHLWCMVAKANNCRCLIRDKQWPKEQRGVVLMGRKSDRDHVKLLTQSLLLQTARLSLTACPDYLTPKERNLWRRSFRFGFADAVGDRMATAHRQAAQSHTKGDMLPVLVKVDERVKQYEQENFNPKKARAVKIDGAGSAAGRAAGRKADVGSTRVSGAKGALGR